MALQFPTQAEQALTAWQARTETTTVAKIARWFGAYDREFEYPETRYLFEDDTQLVVTGKGVAHRLETRLP
jgi:hypothetical protein